MLKNSKQILSNNLEDFVVQIINEVENGWELDPNYPPGMFFHSYECGLVRDSEIQEEIKRSRAEILAKARAAKAAKKGNV